MTQESKQYYEKVLISSGEVPEKSGLYDTDLGKINFILSIKEWFVMVNFSSVPDIETTKIIMYPYIWYKPFSPKEEVVELLLDFVKYYNEQHYEIISDDFINQYLNKGNNL